MMKKMLILMFILGLVSTANASVVTFKGDGESGTVIVSAGDTVEITVVADVSVTSAYALSVTETKDSAAGYATAPARGTLNASFNYNVNHGSLRNAMTTHTSMTNRYIVTDKASAGMNPAGNITAGSALYTFSVVIPSAASNGDSWFLTAAVGQPVYASPPPNYTHTIDAVNVGSTNGVTLLIPEPMTLVLLGLGGLFLRRRK